MPRIIKDNESIGFVYILPKFVLDENEKISIELRELNGGRNIILKTKL